MTINFRRCLALAGAVLAVSSASAGAAIFTRVALLTGSQETPPNASAAIGCARFVIDTDANTVTYRISYTGLSAVETAAHFHGPADPGVAAGVIKPLPAGGPVKSGTWNYNESDEADILSGQEYVNIHTAAFPNGEIRGQMVSAVADLDGSQETPPNTSTGRGVALINIDPVTHSLSYYVTFTGLSSPQTASHIHGVALPGTPAGIINPIPVGSPSTGSWSYGAGMENNVIDGLTYVNIHTTNFPGGEIRGQIVTSVNPMDPAQEVPPTPTQGAGITLISIDRANHTLGYGVRFAGLSAAQTASHIHGYSVPGVSSGVLNPIPLGSPSRGTWVYPAADESKILGSMTYTNIHTVNFGGGEIRGQINFAQLIPPPVPCAADLNGDGQVDFSDYLEFLNLYDAQDPAADFNQDGQVDFSDYLEFLNHYDAGC